MMVFSHIHFPAEDVCRSLWLNQKLLWKHTPFAVEGHLRWFHNWAIVNNAIDLNVHVPFNDGDFEYMPRMATSPHSFRSGHIYTPLFPTNPAHPHKHLWLYPW